MKYETVIFDFDGTIADSEQAFIQTMNTLAPEFGFRPVAQIEVQRLKMMSTRELIRERLGIPLWNLWKIYKLEKRGREELNQQLIGVKVFPGMKDAIERLRQSGLTVGVLSSNSEPIINEILQKAGIKVDFVDAGIRKLGKVQAIKKVLRRRSLDRIRTIYVGDEVLDVEACKKVGIDIIAVGWGYNTSEALEKTGMRIVYDPDELLTMLTRSK